MKKKMVLLMCTVLMMVLVGCGQSNAGQSNDTETPDGDTTETISVDAVDSADLLTKVWNTYDEADKFMP